MCAWCYGFTPVVRRLQALWNGRLQIQIIPAGLHPFAEEPLTHKQKENLAVSWHQVQGRTQLPFNFGFFLNKSYYYTTEPACRALVVVKHLRPVLALEFLRALHSAFYADGQDISRTETLAYLAGLFGIPENLFLTLFEADSIIDETEDGFRFVEDVLGASKLPSMYIETGQGPELLVQGYCSLNELEGRLIQHLHEHHH